MRRSFVGVVAGVALAAAALSAPGASAASSATDAYLHAVGVNLAFLKQSSRLASGHAKAAAIKSLAEDEADNLPLSPGQTTVADAQSDTLPTTVSAGLSADEGAAGEMQTGRSAYSPEHPAVPTDQGAVASSAALGFGLLSSATGGSFDALYRSTHVNSLTQLADLFYSYTVTGDDPSLRAAARRDFPMVKALLEQARQAQ